MRKVLLTLALLGMAVGFANADPSNLEGGVLIAHYVPELPYTTDPPAAGWCAEALNYLPGGPELANTQIDVSTYAPVVWYVIAAWEMEDKTWCGTEFGFADYDPAIFAFSDASPCFPVDGLEIPTSGWPGPNQGTAFVVTGDAWMGNYVPVYFFGGYAYGSFGAGEIALANDPPTGFAGFGNCSAPPAQYACAAEQLGGMGVNMAGAHAMFPIPEPPQACCFDTGECQMLLAADCMAAGGVPQGPDTVCDPNPCEQPGACCVGGLCEVLFEEACGLLGGIFLPGMLCEPNPCEAVCCYGDTLHECMITVEDECAAMNGAWHPEWTSCEPNPCDMYTPTNDASWGTIKNLYR
jgi:hypothetical protein